MEWCLEREDPERAATPNCTWREERQSPNGLVREMVPEREERRKESGCSARAQMGRYVRVVSVTYLGGGQTGPDREIEAKC